MATELISALGNFVRKVVIIGTAGVLAGIVVYGEIPMEESAEEGSIDKVCLDGLLSEVMEMDEKISKFLAKNSDKTGNITSLIIPTVTFGALAYGIMCLKKDISSSNSLAPTNQSITATGVFELREKINDGNQQINNINRRLADLESILLAKKTQSSGELGLIKRGFKKLPATEEDFLQSFGSLR